MYDFRFGRIQDLSHHIPRIRSLEERFKHTYIIGTTGTGKTSLMLRMALYDAMQGLSLIFIDPKGDHARELYSLIPDKRRVIYFSIDRPSLVINPLRKTGYNIYDIIDEFVEILNILVRLTTPFNPPATQAMRELLRACLPYFKEEDRSIEFLSNFLRYQDVRDTYFKQIGEEKPKYWQDFDKKKGRKEHQYNATAISLASRLGGFIEDERFRRIVTGPNQLDIAKISKQGKIVLVDVSGLSDEKRIYLSALFSFAVKSYVEFQKMPESERKPLMFYFDECYMGINETFDRLLAFARSYKVGLTLAHQSVEQFESERVLRRIVSLCNTKIGFRAPGYAEARLLAETYGLTQEDFRSLKQYEAWVRFDHRGAVENSHIKTYPPPHPVKLEEPLMVDLAGAREADPGPAPISSGPEEINFLRDAWFSC
ncbi:type IV secretory system conjugative DNA transfer family protein [Desulfatibacillum aliphaticivorans]|uniref:type IV secretory system conjugative DNA transfer family protein n=1 Tax=Desulfatibacillum aliphaticivorans TaxID=218208 RepID=UPI00041F35AA|nr:DUF87 domain-containing protein [Desulfatibacillum aliphaticivorans]